MPEMISPLSETTNKHLSVTDTSAIVHRKRAARFNERAQCVLAWLESFGVCADPTSAELAHAVVLFPRAKQFRDFTSLLLFVRRGLSDLKALGKAKHADNRLCRLTHETAKTWRAVNDL